MCGVVATGFWIFDLDDVGPQVAQQLGAGGTGENAAEIEDDKSVSAPAIGLAPWGLLL